MLDWIMKGINYFFTGFFQDFISFFGEVLANVMSTSLDVLNLDIVNSAIRYSQGLAFTLLVLKTMNDAFQTYILYQNGDPDADPSGLLIRTAQGVAVIAFMPDLVRQVFVFGSKLSLDVSGLSVGDTGISDWAAIIATVVSSGGTVLPIIYIVLAVMLLVVAFQAAIRGAELARVSIIGSIMAINITSNNKSIWSSWFKQLVIICTAQSLQILMITGAMSLMTNKIISGKGTVLIFAWLWVAIKTPKYLEQFAYSTGFTGAVGGTAKQVGSMAIMRKMMAAK
jgi:hypothetical protein